MQTRGLILGILELLAALSIFQGAFGRYFAIFVAALAAIGELLEIPPRPLWLIAVFALTLWIIGAEDDHQAGTGELRRTCEPELEGGSSRWNR
jgi:hypothetical protein